MKLWKFFGIPYMFSPTSAKGLVSRGWRAMSRDTKSSSITDIEKDGQTIVEVQRTLSDPLSGEVTEQSNHVDFATMSWWHVGLLMIAEVISLGILSLPSAFATLGLIPSIFLILAFGIVATYTGYIMGLFKLAYPQICSIADAGELLFTPLGCPRLGRELFGIIKILFLVFICAAHLLTFSIMMNVLTNHGACTVIFMLVGMLLSILLTIPRTLKNVSYMSMLSCISILTAVLLVTIYTGIHPPHWGAISLGLPKDVSRIDQFVAVSDITLAYAGNVAFFGFFSELRDPKTFPKAIAVLQISSTTLYIIAAALIYTFVGAHVPSPALGAAPPLIQKIAYGIAIPTILVAGVINGHVACRWIFNRACGWHENKICSKSAKTWTLWIGIVVIVWTMAWLFAEAIPVFNSLLALVSSLFGSWFTYGVSGWLWLYMYRKTAEDPKRANIKRWKRVCGTVVSIALMVLAVVLCVIGTYGSVASLLDAKGDACFSCASNAPKFGRLAGVDANGTQITAW